MHTISCHGQHIPYKHLELSPQALAYHIDEASQEYGGVQVMKAAFRSLTDGSWMMNNLTSASLHGHSPFKKYIFHLEFHT